MPGVRLGFPTGQVSALHATADPGRRSSTVWKWPHNARRDPEAQALTITHISERQAHDALASHVTY
jgi:hypothetical protein